MKRRRCKQTSTNRTFTLKSKDSSQSEPSPFSICKDPASQQCYASSVAPELNPQVNVGRITDSAQSSNSPATCSYNQSPHLSGFFVSSSPLATLSSKESCHVPECSQIPISLSSESFSAQNGINRQDTHTINYNGDKSWTKEKEGPKSKVEQFDSKCVANSRKRKFSRSLSDTILTIKHQCCVHGNIPLEFLPRQKPLIKGNSNVKAVKHKESDGDLPVDESPEANQRLFEQSSGASSSQVSVIKSSLVAEPTYKYNTKAISRASSTCRKVSVKVSKLSSRDIFAYTTSQSTHSDSTAVSHKTKATSPKSKVSSNICASLSNSSDLDPSASHHCNRNTGSDKLSPYLSEDSLFHIASQGKACNHFIFKLKENNNVQTSTQNSPCKKLQSSQSICHCSATPFTSTLNSVKESLRSFNRKSLHQESHHIGFILSETSTGKPHPNLSPTANVSNVLNQAYLTDSLKEVKDASGSRFRESFQELREQSPSNSDHVASLCTDEGSKSTHKTSSKIRNSSTNSSSCIVESSVVLGEAIPVRGMNSAPSKIQDTEKFSTYKKSRQQNKHLINFDGKLKLVSNEPSISSRKTISPLKRTGNLSTELGSKKKISRRKKKKLYLRQKIRHRREIKKKKEFERLATISCTRNLRKSFRLKDCSVILDASSRKNCFNLTSTSKENLSAINMTSSHFPPHRAPTPSIDHSKGKSMLLLRDLKYFCVDVHQVDEYFLDFHGLLPTLRVKPCAPQKRKRESNLPDCSNFMVNCKRRKMGPSSKCKRDDSPSKQLITTSSKECENSVPSEGFFFRTSSSNNTKKSLCLSATKKFQRTEATTPQTKERGASTNTSSRVGSENSMHTSSSPDMKEEVKTRLTEDSSSDEREKSYSTETIECVEAGLMHISPPISENLISAICGRCNKLIPYGTAEMMEVSEETMWPNNKVPLCATKSCKGRPLYWGIFKAQLMLKTTKGEYLIAQINDPNAEKFFGCSAAQFFKDPAHKKRIQKRISELLLINKRAEDIIMKKYNLIMIRNGNELRIRILHTSLFEP